MAKFVELVVESGYRKGTIYRIVDGARAFIGRSESLDIVLAETTVSANHCTIENNNGQAIITDMDSTNGTLVNGQAVLSCPLKNGDEIRLGDVQLKYKTAWDSSAHPQITTRFTEADIARSTIRYEIKHDVDFIEATVKEKKRPESVKYRQAFDELRTIYRIIDALSNKERLRDIFNIIVDEIFDTVKADRAAIILTGPGGKNDPAMYRAFTRAKQDSVGGDMIISKTVVQDVINHNVATVLKDVSRSRRYKTGGSLVLSNARALMCVPISGKETILGALYLDSVTGAQPFKGDELRLISALGHHAGLAIERAQLIDRLHRLFVGSVRTLVAAIDAKDNYTHGHSERVTAYSLALCDYIGIKDRERRIIELSGLLHDVGKIGVPEAVLNKPAGLEYDEYEIIKRHPVHGAMILKNIPYEDIDQIYEAVRAHHERWDGSGYPDGLEGDQIPLAARILAIADSYDAMTSNRPYRYGLAKNEALEKLQENAGSQLDEALVRFFIEMMSEGFVLSIHSASSYMLRDDDIDSLLPIAVWDNTQAEAQSQQPFPQEGSAEDPTLVIPIDKSGSP